MRGISLVSHTCPVRYARVSAASQRIRMRAANENGLGAYHARCLIFKCFFRRDVIAFGAYHGRCLIFKCSFRRDLIGSFCLELSCREIARAVRSFCRMCLSLPTRTATTRRRFDIVDLMTRWPTNRATTVHFPSSRVTINVCEIF